MPGLTSALALKREGFQNVEVFETASDLGLVGAGIQLAPNMSRILDGLGVWKDIEREAVELKRTSIREGSTDEELGSVRLGYVREEYGYPHMVGHRHSLTRGLYNGCKKYPDLKFHFGTSVHEVYDFSPRPSFTISSRGGEKKRVECDILLINTSGVSRWIGERRHKIAYPISSKRIYNISTTQPDINFASSPSETYTTKGSKTTMLKVFEDFNPKKLSLHAPLPTWVWGNMALVGDACHPTLLHLAQGAAQAVGDGTLVTVCLGKLKDATRESVNRALRVYEKIRKERAENIVELVAASARSLHLGEGKMEEERDRMFRDLGEGRSKDVPDKWADAEVQKMVYGVDCVGIARERFGEFWEELEREDEGAVV
ncbi:hypothetical protein BOTCAL_0027g00050 [Botryotinia calthae]|uniref:FAD-binding domain-containing protein n=1 Tax=Botryotinia calthae TaxID=38488 RepID=A0A4Y8DDU0_9HELO|nr:hypothetical protein BOTCAL_0027g00050 [Botryotinia calthae]